MKRPATVALWFLYAWAVVGWVILVPLAILRMGGGQ